MVIFIYFTGEKSFCINFICWAGLDRGGGQQVQGGSSHSEKTPTNLIREFQVNHVTACNHKYLNYCSGVRKGGPGGHVPPPNTKLGG